MSKVGVLWVGFNTEQYVAQSLQPWLNMRARFTNPNEIPSRRVDEFVIGAVSVPFRDFPQARCDRTAEMLEQYKAGGWIDHLHVSDVPTTEVAARGAMLRQLVNDGCEICLQVDSDEVYQEDEIARIFDYVRMNTWIWWFRLSLKNAVFTPTTFLAEPFTPARIHRVVVGGWAVNGFWDDNNVTYSDGTKTRRDTEFASMTIPTSIAWIKHLSWLDDGPNGRSRAKLRYQSSRWSGVCSFRWDEPTNSLAFNEAYYRARGEPLPEVVHESS